jgi:hypothetical protein
METSTLVQFCADSANPVKFVNGIGFTETKELEVHKEIKVWQ